MKELYDPNAATRVTVIPYGQAAEEDNAKFRAHQLKGSKAGRGKGGRPRKNT